MRFSIKVIVIILAIGVILFGYSQFMAALQLGITVTQSNLLDKTEAGSTYDIELKFNNPSLLTLSAGKTEFFVISDEKIIGKGELESFVLPSLGSILVSGTFLREAHVDSQEISVVKITGVTKYNVIFTSMDVPFVFYPTKEQAREFIHPN